MRTLDDLPGVSTDQMEQMEAAYQKQFGKVAAAPLTEDMNEIPYHNAPKHRKDEYQTQPGQQQHYEQPVEQPMYTQPEEPVEQYEQPAPIDDEDLPVVPETKREYNTRMMREKNERLEYEMKQLQYQLERERSYRPVEVQKEEDYGVADDELLEGKHYKPLMKEIRALRDEVKNYKQQTVTDTTELRIKNQFPDFDQVVSQKNLDELYRRDPDLADMIYNERDLLKQSKIAYKQIMQMGIHKVPYHNSDKELIRGNAAKPRSMGAVAPQSGSSPLSQANAWSNGKPTKELHEQMMREMADARRNG